MLRFATRAGVGRTLREGEALPPIFGVRWLNQVVNLHKVMCFPVIAAVLWWHEQLDSVGPMLYLAMHGSYGICWILKSLAFPDAGFYLEIGPVWALACFLVASVHWSTAYVVATISYADRAPPEAWRVCAAVMTYTVGVFCLYTSDCQKYFVLKHQQPRRLITQGMFARSRNTNYLGEILVYSAFALLARHALPWILIAAFTLVLFLPNMIMKDISLRRYSDFLNYEGQSSMLLPRLFVGSSNDRK